MGSKLNTPVIHTTAAAARIVNRRPQTLRLWRLRGSGPPFVRLSGNPGRGPVGYPDHLLRQWIASRTYNSTSQETAAAAKKIEVGGK